jgi:hypothetical protein
LNIFENFNFKNKFSSLNFNRKFIFEEALKYVDLALPYVNKKDENEGEVSFMS